MPLPEDAWIEPVPDARVMPSGGDPADVAVARESIRLAFVAALQHLPPRQRAVLILREVLRWHADEVAELLDTSVPSVNSALQRARATLASKQVDDGDPADPLDAEQQALLKRYVDAFERYDMDALTALLHDDAKWSMPPYELWLQTNEDVVKWCLGPGFACRGSRLIPTMANGMFAFGQYKPDPAGGLAPWSLQVVELSGDRIAGITFFLDTERYFPLFGLPAPPRRLAPRDRRARAARRRSGARFAKLQPPAEASGRERHPGQRLDRPDVGGSAMPPQSQQTGPLVGVRPWSPRTRSHSAGDSSGPMRPVRVEARAFGPRR